MPWGNPGDHHDFEPQRHDDGYIEVIGFTMASLVSNISILLKTLVYKARVDFKCSQRKSYFSLTKSDRGYRPHFRAGPCPAVDGQHKMNTVVLL